MLNKEALYFRSFNHTYLYIIYDNSMSYNIIVTKLHTLKLSWCQSFGFIFKTKEKTTMAVRRVKQNKNWHRIVENTIYNKQLREVPKG